MQKHQKAKNWLIILLGIFLAGFSIWSVSIILNNISQQAETAIQSSLQGSFIGLIDQDPREGSNNLPSGGNEPTTNNIDQQASFFERNEFFIYGTVGLFFVILIVFLWAWSSRRLVIRRTAELRASEKKYRQLINSANEGIVIIVDQKIEYYNPQVASIFNFHEKRPEEPINLLDHIHPLDHELLLIKYHQLLENLSGNSQLSCRIITTDGLTKWIRSNSVKIDWEKKPAIVSFISDITEEHKLEESITASEERYRQIFDQSPVGMFYYDTELRITNINDRFIEIMDSDRKQLQDFNLNTIKDSKITNVLKNVFTHENGSYEGWIQPFRSKNNDKRYVKLRTTPMLNEKLEYQGGIGLIEDLTEQILSEQKIHSLEERFSKVVFTSTDAVSITSMRDGVFIDINREFTELTGFTREDVIGKSVFDIELWKDPGDRKKLVKFVLEKGEHKNFETQIRRKDGIVHQGLMSASIIEIDNKPCMLTITRDVDEINKNNEIVRNSELRYRSIFESVPVSIWQMDMVAVYDQLENLRKQGVENLQKYMKEHPDFVKDGIESIKVTDVNEVSVSFYKADSKEQLISSLGSILNVESLFSFEQELLAIWNHESQFNGDSVNQTLDGERILVNLVMKIPSTRDGFKNVLVCLTDVTRRKQTEEALRESENRYKKIFNSVPVSIKEEDFSELKKIMEKVRESGVNDFEAFLEQNPKWVKKAVSSIKVNEVNQESLKIYEADSKEEMLQSVDRYFSEDSYVSFHKQLIAFWNHETVFEQETVNKTLKGEKINMWVSIEIPPENADCSRILVTAMDITERKRSEEQIKLQLRYLAALRAVDMAISASMDLPITLRVILNQIHQQLIADAVSILILDQHTQTLKYAAGIGFKTNAIESTNLRLGQSLAGKVALERRTFTSSGLEKTTNLIRTKDFEKENFSHYIGIPLISKGTVKGVLELFNHEPFTDDSSWMGLIESMAGQAAIAIENASLLEEVQKVNLNLRSAYDATIEGWARSIDMRCGDSEDHSKRVAELTIELAQATGFQGEGLLDLRRGALLHDIGKLSIPDSILLKQGPLTDDEWNVVRSHPAAAKSLLSNVEFLHSSIEIPLFHHEHWDGSGYPDGLAGEKIPFAARLFAVVNTWVSLRSDRPWRKAWSDENAWEFIEQNSGKLFDPQLVEKFRQLLGHGFGAYY